MKKILVPVDFSNYSEYALEIAAQIAREKDAEIVVLHMMGLTDTSLKIEESRKVFEAIYHLKLTETRFREFLDKEYLKGLKVTDTVQNYKIFSELDQVAEELGVDLIVMGSHGSSGLKEVFVGSNTEKVVRTSRVPVLVVKHRNPNFKMEKVVFACDFNLDLIAPFKKALDFFNSFGSEVQLLFVNLPEKFMSTQEMEAQANKFMNEAEIYDVELFQNIVHYNDYTLEDGIYSFSNSYNADVIALPTHGRRGLAHFFSLNVGEAIVNHTDLPIITFKM
ncbi:universal stress protein [Gillisia sp. M10.2A]|uniref:Universal stress protein n=1 Tax=Gillisia lutea TaxID=2909668 RepID=A0ABS9EE32_9FLAO|nr:universal stress protein [Gillisia lutea]MCF4101120.1 universal stress protein [Gillisia lutea]